MNILEISLEAPSEFSGGGIVIKQSICSLANIGHVDYVGPQFDATILSRDTNISILKILDYDSNPVSRLFGAAHGTVSGYYHSWKNIIKVIHWNKYDIIHIEFSKYAFLVIDALNHTSVPVYVRVHNIETDYYMNLLKIHKSPLSFIQYKSYARNEKKCFEKADKLICITEQDKDRICSFVPQKRKQIFVNPVCIEDKDIKKVRKNNNTILITGSLWFRPNSDGIIWFIEKVWPEIKNIHDKLRIIIAGSNPNDKLRKIADKYGACLIANPKNIEEIFAEASIYVAPIFSGAGMKVKVAEGLLYGLPVLATKHALLGYVPQDGVALCECNDKESFVHEINRICQLQENEYKELCDISRDYYLKYYSLHSSIDFYRSLIGKNDESDESFSMYNNSEL